MSPYLVGVNGSRVYIYIHSGGRFMNSSRVNVGYQCNWQMSKSTGESNTQKEDHQISTVFTSIAYNYSSQTVLNY